MENGDECMDGALYDGLMDCQAQLQNMQQAIARMRVEKAGQVQLPDSKAFSDVKQIRRHAMKQRRLLKGHFAKVYAVEWCSDEQEDKILSVAQDGKLIIWDALSTAKLLMVDLRSQWAMTGTASPSGELVAAGGLDNTCTVYKTADYKDTFQQNQPYRALNGHTGFLSSCKFIGEDKILTASGDGTCALWDVEKEQVIRRFEGHENDVMSLDLVNDKMFITGSTDGTACAWDVRTGDCMQTFAGHEGDVNAVKMFPDGQAFGTASDDGSLRLFDFRSWSQVNMYMLEGQEVGASAIDFSGSGRYLFGGYDDFNVLVWDTLSGAMLSPKLNYHAEPVSCLAVNPEGSALCAGSFDSDISIFA